MAKNDVVLLDSLVAKARSQFVTTRDDSELFEVFCFDQVLKDFDPSSDELESGWTDGGNDGGIDGFFVHVDGRAATPDIASYSSRKNPSFCVNILTVKRTPSFEQEPLDSLISSLGELLDLGVGDTQLKYPYNEVLLAQRGLFSSLYIELAERQPHLAIRIHYCSRGDSDHVAEQVSSRARVLVEQIRGLFSQAEVSFSFTGASELLTMARRQKDFSLRLPYLETYISREGKNYILLCSLSAYFRFITDAGGALRRYLFESNVRDYLGEVLITRDIHSTLMRQERPDVADFWWLNNGVTIIGTGASIVGKEICIENVQIVNGLQTTETLYRYFSEAVQDDDPRAILVKIILAADDDIRARIIKATNYQNTVDLTSLRGLDKIQRDIEAFLADHGWFYDRRRNFYKNQGKPSDRIVSMSYLASAVRAIALGDPAKSQKQRSRSLRDEQTYRQVFDASWDLHVYLASLEITRAVEIALHTRRNVWDSPPISLVHFIGYVYTCRQLGKHRYHPNEVAKVAGHPPSKEEVASINDELKKASAEFHVPGRTVRGVKLSRPFIERYAAKVTTWAARKVSPNEDDS
jgi:hypothetical protein